MMIRIFKNNIRASVFGVRSYQTNNRIPELTEKWLSIERGQYSKVNENDLKTIEGIVSASNVIDKDDVQKYNIDFLRKFRGSSSIVVKPKTTEEVSALLKFCNERKFAVCPQGGNTGLVGGSVPVFDEIIISLERMNKIHNINEFEGIISCEAGCILENLDNKAKEKGLRMPLDLGAKQSCQIGGNVSTNAGGLRLVRYGNLHGNVLGLEAVLANGTVLNMMSESKKDNTGYHLKHLFIGSEGTLGIITKISIHCPPDFKSVHVAFLGLSSYENVLSTFMHARHFLGEIISSCELIDSDALESCTKSHNLQSPIKDFPFYMLIETSGSDENHDSEKLNNFLDKAISQNYVIDGIVTNEPGKIQKIWTLRELVPVSLIADGYCFKYDISIPLKNLYDIVIATREMLGLKATRVCGYGHLGDSNLHLNVNIKEFSQEIFDILEPFVYENTAKYRGSISAEHGIGVLKQKYLPYSKTPEAIDLMKQLKVTMDPNNILNPYKILC